VKRTVAQPFSPGRMGFQKLGDVEGAHMDKWASGVDTALETKRRIRQRLQTAASNVATPIFSGDELASGAERSVEALVQGVSLDGLNVWVFRQTALFGRGAGAPYLAGSFLTYAIGPAGPAVTIDIVGGVPTVSVDDNGTYSINWTAYIEEMERRP
jgi:hypothetical protein